jgi:hypothetical protein
MTTTESPVGIEGSMPDSWDSERYRQRAEEWRKKAESLGEGKERRAYLTIAEGYAKLAETIENRSRQYRSMRQVAS